MKAFSILMIVTIILCGCGAGNTEQTRTTVSDYNILAGIRNDTTTSSQSNDSQGSNISSSSIVGSWKTISKSGYWPYAIGSSLIVNSNGSFTISPDGYGSYTLQGSSFKIDFGSAGVLVFSFSYSISGNTLTLHGLDSDANITFERI